MMCEHVNEDVAPDAGVDVVFFLTCACRAWQVMIGAVRFHHVDLEAIPSL